MAVIEQTHGNITLVKKDDTVVFEVVSSCDSAVSKMAAKNASASIPDQVKAMGFEELVALAGRLSSEDVDYVWGGIEMNLRISDFGFDHKVGLGLGRIVRDSAGVNYRSDLAAQVKAVASLNLRSIPPSRTIGLFG